MRSRSQLAAFLPAQPHLLTMLSQSVTRQLALGWWLRGKGTMLAVGMYSKQLFLSTAEIRVGAVGLLALEEQGSSAGPGVSGGGSLSCLQETGRFCPHPLRGWGLLGGVCTP